MRTELEPQKKKKSNNLGNFFPISHTKMPPKIGLEPPLVARGSFVMYLPDPPPLWPWPPPEGSKFQRFKDEGHKVATESDKMGQASATIIKETNQWKPIIDYLNNRWFGYVSISNRFRLAPNFSILVMDYWKILFRKSKYRDPSP